MRYTIPARGKRVGRFFVDAVEAPALFILKREIQHSQQRSHTMNESTNNTLQPVPFHGDTIYCIDHQDQPFTPMKPIVENMGISWQGQNQKLNANKERWGITMIVIPSQGGNQDMVCMPVRKLPAYLNTINPKKVSEKLREKIIRYQEESDDVLWAYWMEHRKIESSATLPAPVAHIADDTDEITRELCAMIRQNMDGKTLAEKINIWGRVTGALDGQNPSGPKAENTSLMKQSELWTLAQGRKAGTEIAVADALKKALALLDTAFQTSGFLDRGTTESVRKSLVIACRCNIDAAGAIARALIASDGKPKLAAA